MSGASGRHVIVAYSDQPRDLTLQEIPDNRRRMIPPSLIRAARTSLYKPPQLQKATHVSSLTFSTSSIINMSSFYDLKAPLPNGETLDFSTLKGKIVLIVNTASAW